MSAIRKNGPDKDQCNLCTKAFSCLSFDHVPPESVQKILHVSVEPNSPDAANTRKLYSQNGVKYRTICKECNNRLGVYDKALAEFTRETSGLYDHVFSRLTMTKQSHDVEIDIHSVYRSLCGHLVAAKSFIDHGEMDDLIRSFVFDKAQPVPGNLNIFYWLYPHYEVRIKRDFVFVDDQISLEAYFGSVIKFYPLAFFFTMEDNFMGLPNLREALTANGSRTKLSVNFANQRHAAWPEGNKDAIAGITLHTKATSEAIIGYWRPKAK